MEGLPEKVYAIGILRRAAGYLTPIRDEESGLGMAPLTVLDADGERAMPVFTTREKAERGIRHFMSEEERTENAAGAALTDLGSLLETMADSPAAMPKVDYVGVDMGVGGAYTPIRL
jgi:hypothetical protein